MEGEENQMQKSVITGFEPADYNRLIAICDDLGVAVSSYIEDATIMRMNQHKIEKGETEK